jgi:hypothetical protein
MVITFQTGLLSNMATDRDKFLLSTMPLRRLSSPKALHVYRFEKA